VEARRRFNTHAFFGETIKIHLDVQNKGWLPLPWLELRETLPVALVGPRSFQTATSLGPRADAQFEYSVEARKRGYYPIGPLSITTGDILGLSNTLQEKKQAEALVVYPRIIPFTSMEIPSLSPQGELRHRLPLFEDPTRSWQAWICLRRFAQIIGNPLLLRVACRSSYSSHPSRSKRLSF
jgi:uncharacterized protein (DUF58 family)